MARYLLGLRYAQAVEHAESYLRCARKFGYVGSRGKQLEKAVYTVGFNHSFNS